MTDSSYNLLEAEILASSIEAAEEFELGELHSLYDLEAALRQYPHLYVRYSAGPAADSRGGSVDTESGLELPGLSVNPLEPERWWLRPVSDWLSRQLCQYKHLQEKNPDRFAWVLTGTVVARGPDCEPLLAQILPVAKLGADLLDEAEANYAAHFDAGNGPE